MKFKKNNKLTDFRGIIYNFFKRKDRKREIGCAMKKEKEA